jgi:hypothetical protein
VSDRLWSGLLVVEMMRYNHHMLGFLFYMRRAAVGWGESQDGWCTRKGGRYDAGRLTYGFKRRKTNFLSGQPILMVERLGGVRRAARVKPNLRHGEFLLPPGSTLEESLFF